MTTRLTILCLIAALMSACGTDTKKELHDHYTRVAANAVKWHDYTTAANAWQNLYVLDESDAPLLDSLYYSYVRTQNYNAVVALGRDIARAHKRDEAFISAIAVAYKETGDYKSAIEAYTAVLTLTHDSLLTYYNMGMSYLELQNYLTAAACMDRVVADTASLHRQVAVKGINVPYLVAALNVIGISEIKMGHPDRGLKALTEAVKLAPNFAPALNNLNTLRRLQGAAAPPVPAQRRVGEAVQVPL